jgi:hypothetical protein
MFRLTILIAATWCCQALAGPIEDDAFAAFETFCIFKLNSPEQIPGMVEYIGAPELRGNAARPYLGAQKGRAWMMRRDAGPFVLLLADDGTCGLFAPDGDRSSFRAILNAYPAATLAASEPVGTEQHDLYVIVAARKDDGPDFRAAIMLRASNLASVRGAYLSAIPEKLMNEKKMAPPTWPKAWRPN